jgi:hypothetical protein
MSLDKEVKERNFDRTMRLVLLLIVSIMCDMTKKSIMHIHVKHFYFFKLFFSFAIILTQFQPFKIEIKILKKFIHEVPLVNTSHDEHNEWKKLLRVNEQKYYGWVEYCVSRI